MKHAIRQLAKTGIRWTCSFVSCFNRKIRPSAPQRILLIAGGYLGDTFWALQVIPYLKKAYPGAVIHVAGRPFVRVLAHTLIPEHCLHEVSIVSDRTRETFHCGRFYREAKALRDSVCPDLVIDLMDNRYSAFFCFLLNAYSVGLDLAEETAPLYSFCAKRARVPSVH